jgi:hypothetical protein
VRPGLRIASRHCCETGCFHSVTTGEKRSRTACGSVGAVSGAPVCGLMHAWSAWSLRNERGSRKNSSRLRPQRIRRYVPPAFENVTGE